MYTQYEFHEILSIDYLVMAEDEKKSLKCWQLKGNNSSITDYILIKLQMHNHTMSIYIYIQYKLYEMPSLGYLVMAEDGKTHCNLGNQMSITPL